MKSPVQAELGRGTRPRHHINKICYAAPNRTDTSFDTPGSCMVTP